MVQTAVKGSYPEVMCATEDELERRALFGPTGGLEMVGPVGRGTLEPYAYEKPVMQRLWAISEQATGFEWNL